MRDEGPFTQEDADEAGESAELLNAAYAAARGHTPTTQAPAPRRGLPPTTPLQQAARHEYAEQLRRLAWLASHPHTGFAGPSAPVTADRAVVRLLQLVLGYDAWSTNASTAEAEVDGLRFGVRQLDGPVTGTINDWQLVLCTTCVCCGEPCRVDVRGLAHLGDVLTTGRRCCTPTRGDLHGK